VDRAKKQIVELGGKVLGEGFGSDSQGRSAFMLAFSVKEESFKIVWPVLKPYRDDPAGDSEKGMLLTQF
jgi:hypothetical protein